jgi:hypothetical protein
MVISFDFRHHLPAFVQMADQVLPVALQATWLSIIIVTVLIAVPAGAAFIPWMPQKRSALLICVAYVFLSSIFLVIVQAARHFEIEFRYLLQIYPFILIGAAIAADRLLNCQRLNSRILGFIIVGLLSIAVVRSTRAAALGLLGHGSQQSASCVSRIAILDDLKRIPTQSASGVLTNIQGLAWYAMRIPMLSLTKSALADAPSGTIIVFARPEFTCPEVLESGSISEMEITRSPDVSIVSSSSGLLIGSKQ